MVAWCPDNHVYVPFWPYYSAATFCSNLQFVIKLEDVDEEPNDGEDGCTFLVGLMQKDGRTERRFGRDLNTIGFAIYQVLLGKTQHRENSAT